MRAILRSLALLSLLLPLAGSLVAQRRGLRPVERDGSGDRSFYVIVGAAQGNETYRFDSDPPGWSEKFSAPALMLGAGGTLSRDFTLGFEWNIWADYGSDSDQKLQALSLVSHWYPMGSPVFLKGGLGLGFNRIDDASGSFRDTGIGATFGLGLDLPIARHVAIQPRVDVYIQRYDDPGQANDYQERLAQIGVALRFR